MRKSPFLFACAAVLTSAMAQSATTTQTKHWLPTWGTAEMVLPSTADAAKNLPVGKQAVTLRQVVHISQGGKRMRITFTNEFGTTPLRIDAAHVAFLSAGSKILMNTDRPLTFSGQPGITIAPGQFASSDAVVETVPIFSDLVISTYLPVQELPAITYHAAAHTTTYVAQGNIVTAEQLLPLLTTPPGLGTPNVTAPLAAPLDTKAIVQSATQPGTTNGTGQQDTGSVLQTTSWYFLKDVEVDRTRKSAAVVAFGDSITDGTGSTSETNRRWPDVLAPLLASGKKTAALSVVNEGIGGNRILHEGTGPSALDRFDREVLNQPGVRYVLMLEGINDIGNMHRAPADAITQQQLEDGLTTLAARAHARGVKFIPATILPYNGAKYFSPDGEQMRQNVNTFIRTSTLFDGFVDFDKVTQDPEHPDRLLPKYDHGDHLHPSDEGYAAMGAAINLKLFRKK
ncbi:MAG: SGNH/GDSL hydrolase family protein [Janthinobacterium lividum]